MSTSKNKPAKYTFRLFFATKKKYRNLNANNNQSLISVLS